MLFQRYFASLTVADWYYCNVGCFQIMEFIIVKIRSNFYLLIMISNLLRLKHFKFFWVDVPWLDSGTISSPKVKLGKKLNKYYVKFSSVEKC